MQRVAYRLNACTYCARLFLTRRDRKICMVCIKHEGRREAA